MSLRELLQNFSWETMSNLPPSELLSLIALGAIGLVVLVPVVVFFLYCVYTCLSALRIPEVRQYPPNRSRLEHPEDAL